MNAFGGSNAGQDKSMYQFYAWSPLRPGNTRMTVTWLLTTQPFGIIYERFIRGPGSVQRIFFCAVAQHGVADDVRTPRELGWKPRLIAICALFDLGDSLVTLKPFVWARHCWSQFERLILTIRDCIKAGHCVLSRRQGDYISVRGINLAAPTRNTAARNHCLYSCLSTCVSDPVVEIAQLLS